MKTSDCDVKLPKKPWRNKAEMIAFLQTLTDSEAGEWIEALEERFEEYRRRIKAGETIRLPRGLTRPAGYIRMRENGELYLEPLQ